MAGATRQSTLTPEQQRAVETTDVGVALSAGAGCGKTSVLTERFLSHLTTPDDAAGDDVTRAATSQLNRLVALTFTERAAREMRDRIRKSVRDKLLRAPTQPEADLWLAILRRLEGAQISTIHSFCATLLRRHAVEAGLDPQFGLLEPNEARTIEAELIEDELRRRLAAKDELLTNLAIDYGFGTVNEIVTFFLKQRYRIDFAAWSTTTPDELVAEWIAFHRQEILPSVIESTCSSPQLATVLRLIEQSPPPHSFFVTRCAELAAAAELLKSATHANFAGLVESIHALAYIKVKGAPSNTWKGAEPLKDEYKAAFEELREALDKLQSVAKFDADQARRAAECSLQLLSIAAPIAEQYEAKKRQLARLDFDDLLVKARDLLCDPEHPEVRRRLAASIERLLVDECQDTDPLQKELIDALLGNDETRRKLFLVGDFKQSIYRFRRADPKIFNDWHDSTREEGRQRLAMNFRSQPDILAFANLLFGDYFGPDHALRAHRPQLTPAPTIEFLWATPGGEVDDGDDAEPTPGDFDSGAVIPLRRAEAEWIARRIRSWFDSRQPLIPHKNEAGETNLRPVEYGDIAILFRALSDADLYEKALDRNGVPYYVVGGKAFYGQQEIFDLLHFLRAVDSTSDDTALAGVLRSPFFSLRDDTLFLLAQHKGGLSGGLFAPSLSEELSAEERRRTEFAAAVLTDLRAVKNRLPIAGLLNEFFTRTAYDAILTGDFLGDRKLANLRKLVEMARQFDASGVFTLSDFIRRLHDAVSQQPDEAPAAVRAEKSPVVRLMTIHQAKGLEFPIVIVPDLQRKSNNARGAAAYDPALGPAVKSPDADGVSGLELFRFLERRKDDEESVRLFYVAVTRAKDLLVLSSGIKPDNPASTGWRAFLGERFDLETGEVKVRTKPDEPRPQIVVTKVIPPAPQDAEKASRRPNWPKLIERAAKERPPAKSEIVAGLQTIAPAESSRRRYSFSRLSGRLERVADDLERLEDAALAGGVDDGLADATSELQGTALGTLIHGVLATLDYARPNYREAAEVERVVRRQALRLQERADLRIVELYQTEAAAIVRQFLESPRAQAIAKAQSLHRELEFVISWPPEKPPRTDGLYLQGFLDCLYEDDAGRLHLVDYKTHRVTSKNAAVAAEPYRGQLGVYALATERILGRPPDELVVCFLRTGAEHVVSWNDDVRRETIRHIQSAFAERPS